MLAILAVLPVRLFLFGDWTSKTLQSSIACAWKVLLAGEPDHVVIHPVAPAEWPKKTARAFWHFCAEVCRWQDDKGCFVTVMHPARTGFFSSQCSRSLKWRSNLSLVTFENQGEHLHGELSFLTNLPDGSLNRLSSLTEGYDAENLFDPRFAILLSHCVDCQRHSDSRQGFLFEDIFEDFEDGALCSLCLRSERNAEALSVLLLLRSILSFQAIQQGSCHSRCISLHRRDLSLRHWFKP